MANKRVLSQEDFQDLVEKFREERDEDIRLKWKIIGLSDGRKWVSKVGYAETDKYVSFMESISTDDKYDQYLGVQDVIADYAKDHNFTDIAEDAFWRGFYEGVTNFWNEIIKQF